ncbi:MAG TPA: hypothetical protein PLM56_18870 [Cyclobacteriaceae bacterium]|nr:hypothetical protein [Cyclobacteriaceae bacterium]
MKHASILFFLLGIVATFQSCTSGKNALKQGDYYQAVSLAVNRLRQNPDHKKSKEVLKTSYQIAVEYLEQNAQNQITSNANFKWKNAVQSYEQINSLYEQIRTSPGALKIIPNPINKYKELTEVKNKAAEESYEAGIQAMLKNTRDDAKRAYFLFTDVNAMSPGYRESIEMIEQAKFNATIKVIVEPTFTNYNNWNFEPVVFGVNPSQFVKFYTPREAEDANLTRVDHIVKVSVNGYNEGRPATTLRTDNYTDSVKVSEKTVNNQKIPVYEKIKAKMVTYEKVVTSRGSIVLYIRDANSGADLRNSDIIAEERWSERWAVCTGDARAIPEATRKLCGTKEASMPRDFLVARTKRELDNKLANVLSGFYSGY